MAWAHDWVSNPAPNASFESLSGSSFRVRGTDPARLGAHQRQRAIVFTPKWALLAKFDGEFSSGSQIYAGSGTLRYTW